MPETLSIPSALGKNRPFPLTKSDPHEEHDLPLGKKNNASDIIHAEGVRFAVPSSAPQARNALSLREDIRALGKSISHRSAAPPGSHVICLRAKAALPSGKSATSFRWWWVTFGEQSRVISRQRRRSKPQYIAFSPPSLCTRNESRIIWKSAIPSLRPK